MLALGAHRLSPGTDRLRGHPPTGTEGESARNPVLGKTRCTLEPLPHDQRQSADPPARDRQRHHRRRPRHQDRPIGRGRVRATEPETDACQESASAPTQPMTRWSPDRSRRSPPPPTRGWNDVLVTPALLLMSDDNWPLLSLRPLRFDDVYVLWGKRSASSFAPNRPATASTLASLSAHSQPLFQPRDPHATRCCLLGPSER